MQSLTIQSSISIEQLYAIIRQLPAVEKTKLYDVLRKESITEQWSSFTPTYIDAPLSVEDIVAETKAYRSEKAQQQ